jgi:dihydrodipicolinate synthase/N-acetylneuraminate lyase
VAPQWVVRVYDAFRRGDLVAARADQDSVHQLVMALRGGVFPAAYKAACHLQGICESWCAAPLQPLDDHSEATLRDRLEAWGLLTPIAPKTAPN